MEQGRLDGAIHLWRDALEKNPGLILVRFNLAAALSVRDHGFGKTANLRSWIR